MADPLPHRPPASLAPLSQAIEVVLQEARRHRRRTARASARVRTTGGQACGRLELWTPAPAGAPRTTAVGPS